jgi:hypothetical protein
MLQAGRSRDRVPMRWIFFFFNLPNPSSRTMGPTQPLTEMSTRNLGVAGVKGSRRVRLTTLPPSVSLLSRQNVGASTSHNPMGLHGLLQGYLYLLFFGLYLQTNIYNFMESQPFRYSRNSSPSMEPEVSLSCSQTPFY